MFKNKKKKQQKKVDQEPKIPDVKQYQLLDDIPLAHDFRSSTILPHLNTEVEKISTLPCIPDGAKHYEQLAAWRHEKNQNRFSNGLFGGKHRGRPKLGHKEEEQVEEYMEGERQLYEPDSEEENYFFQDFSADNNTKKKTKRKLVKKTSPQVSKGFDLSSFAQDLHDNRLSMVQSRSSRILMTEEDERQLEKLLENKRFESSDSLLIPNLVKSQSTPHPIAAPELINKEEISEKLEIDQDEDVPDLKPANSPTSLTRSPSISSTNSRESPLMRSLSISSTQSIEQRMEPRPLKKSPSLASIESSKRPIRRSRSNASIDELKRPTLNKPAFETIQEEQPVLKLSEPKSTRSLFGSLRQVSRSKTTSAPSFKGLVRNLSQASQRPASSTGMSRAAMAVLEHEQKKEEKEEKEEEKPRANSRLISQLISKAARHKKNTKIVNMNDTNRAKVLRRTIIYVQPDSLHDVLKPESKPSSEDELPKEYATATKIVRQTSVRKRVDRQDKKRWQLQSMDESELTKNPDYLEGVELREMSDGSVVWGIVKQQGNRKSFFAPNQNNEYEHVEDEVAPPPIPKRSPKRETDRNETTDIYYSDDVTLPSLLKMMHETHPGDELSVDDQLDEMMRILTSQ